MWNYDDEDWFVLNDLLDEADDGLIDLSDAEYAAIEAAIERLERLEE